MPIHLHPTAPLAERVMLPGDPGRALRLAQELLESPRMFNHNRGLWGYTGTARDGRRLTIQATGIGGPSTAIVASELIELGAERLLRVGTCSGLDPGLGLGELLVATHAVCDDGTSRALGADELISSSPSVLAGLLDAGGAIPSGPVVSTDLFYDAEDRHAGWRASSDRGRDGGRHPVRAGRAPRRRGRFALIVSDTLTGGHVRIDPDTLHEAELRLGQLALAGLAHTT